ncbi:MAG: hypothetical protein ABIJ41_07170 [Candidatus Omnitrophota bacterium]
MEYQCDVCGKKVTGDSLMFIRHSEEHIADVIKKKHPEWDEKNGICLKCLDYYRKEIKGIPRESLS